MKMRKRVFVIGAISIFLLTMRVAHGDATQPILPNKPYLPDLTATAKIAEVVDGGGCFRIHPSFTYTNKSMAIAHNFKYTIEWDYPDSTNTWQIFTLGNDSLGVGQTKIIDYSGSASSSLMWCVSHPAWKPGWRITVDADNTVVESNENNNVATIYYPDITRKVPGTISNPAMSNGSVPRFGSKLKKLRTPVEMQAMGNDSPSKSKTTSLSEGLNDKLKPKDGHDFYIQRIAMGVANNKWHFYAVIRNLGPNTSSDYTTFKLTCSQDFGSCPPGLSKENVHIGTLFPAVDPDAIVNNPYGGAQDVASGQVVSLVPLPIPDQKHKYTFVGEVDPGHTSDENNENNNKRTWVFDPNKIYSLGVKPQVLEQKAPKVASGQMQVKSGTPGFGRQPGQKIQPLVPTQVGRLGAIPKIKKPSLWFDTNKPPTKTTVEINKYFGAFLSVKNIGDVANGNGRGKKVNLITTCTVLSPGGKCTKKNSPAMPEIAPGQTRSVGDPAMFVIEKYGNYKVTMSIAPNQSVAGRRQASLKSKWEWNISLKSRLKVKPTAIKRTTTVPRAVEPQPSPDSNDSDQGGGVRRIIRPRL